MTAAVFGLVGVLVGGLITAGIEWWSARREQARDAEERSRALRAACRLVAMELDGIKTAVVWAERADRWWLEKQLPTQLWIEGRALLARELSPDEWRAVDVAYYSVEALNRVRSLDRPDAVELSRLGRETLTGSFARMLEATGALKRHITEHPDQQERGATRAPWWRRLWGLGESG